MKMRAEFKLKFPCFFACLCGFVLFSAQSLAAQKLAVLTPEKNAHSRTFADKLEGALSENFKVFDASMSEAAFASGEFEKPFNLSLKEAKTIGAAIGCNFFLLVKAENLRRASLSKSEYYESYAAVFVVSARTGRLIFWKLESREAENANEADKKLHGAAENLSAEISAKLKAVFKEEASENSASKIEQLPDENSLEANNLRPPLPYKRIKPEYTLTANLYSIEATVDIEIDVDAGGKLIKSEIARWAGYGLDESVTETVRKMNWRPADRNGKPLPMRVLLRYNFKKLEKEEEP